MELRKYSENISEYGPEIIREPFEVAIMMRESRHWSVYFGQLLYDFSKAVYEPRIDKEVMDEYMLWASTKLQVLNAEIEANLSRPGYSTAFSELNFHWLNYAMISSWGPIVGSPPKNQHARLKNIMLSQDILSVCSLAYYNKREKLASIEHSHEYFAPNNSFVRAVFEGRMNEADTAIVLLDIVKNNPDLTVVPGPPQYEKYAGGANADFLLIDHTIKEIIGVQAKSMVRPQDYHKYDDARIVLVDGTTDLSNWRSARTRSRSSSQQLVSWNGLIALDHLKSMRISSKDSSKISTLFDRVELVKMRHAAHSSLGKISVNRAGIVSLIEPRLKDKLYHERIN